MESTAGDISLVDVSANLWANRLLILITTACFGAAALVTAFLLPEKFSASVVLAPVGDDSVGGKLGGAGALLSQFGGLASLGGLSLGSGGRKSESIATLGSAALAEGFIAEKKLLPVLFDDEWNPGTKTWKESDPADQPTLWKAEQKFAKKVRSVSEDKKTGLVTLTMTWRDPQLAAEWANELVARANASLRARAIEQSQRNLEYLNGQLVKTSVVELQKSIYGLIENEIKQVMVANGNAEFAFKVIDPARAPEKRTSPKRGLITVIGLFVGFMLGIVIALARPSNLPETRT
ncbi:GNVR domain-containing protein [Nevskia sp.]|uniref:GNVR domain-containing protein n=1 Tax=Nevskia sp. TaxID=1929292 RepID=UPI0025DCFBBC|nr:GNVR domain-containing protein [Nevskia sp.]